MDGATGSEAGAVVGGVVHGVSVDEGVGVGGSGRDPGRRNAVIVDEVGVDGGDLRGRHGDTGVARGGDDPVSRSRISVDLVEGRGGVVVGGDGGGGGGGGRRRRGGRNGT